MAAPRKGRRPSLPAPRRPIPPPARVGEALKRLGRTGALQTLVRGAVPAKSLKRLLKDAFPVRIAQEMPNEVWPSLAVGIAVENGLFALQLCQDIHDRLGWDREPEDMDEWWRLVRERPLEALWMASLSESKAVRKEFTHIAEHALENFRSSPDSLPPSWEFVEGVLAVHAETGRQLKDAERQFEDAERRTEVERERLEELREELKRLRRENAELRGGKAVAERRVEALEAEARGRAGGEPTERLEALERRLRKGEKEREHLVREVERLRSAQHGGAPEAAEGQPQEAGSPAPPEHPESLALATDPNPRRRILRQMLRKLFKKGKIGASHTHEDNVYRGVPDHEKGIAKEAMDLLYREGFLVPKPTVTDPHVSLSPDRTGEVRAIISGEVMNPRLARFIEG